LRLRLRGRGTRGDRRAGRGAIPAAPAGSRDHGHRDAGHGRHRCREGDHENRSRRAHPHVQRHGAAGAGRGSHPGGREGLRGEALPARARAGGSRAGARLMDLARYADLFLTESREHLAVMNRHLLVLERSPGARESLDATFRAVHTIKGMSATMGYEAVTALAHEMETVLDALRAGRLAVTASRIAVCLDVADALEGMVEGAVRGDDLACVGEPLVQRLRVLATDGEDAAAAPAVPAATPAAPSGS